MKSIHIACVTTCTLAASLLLATGCNAAPAASNSTTPATPASAVKANPVTITPNPNEPKHAWTESQILTCTVSQCWQLSGKNENAFFDIVQQLAALSAKDRDLTLPETEAAGKQTGEYIKAEAHKDRQQLLYAVVDAAIRKVGTPNKSDQ